MTSYNFFETLPDSVVVSIFNKLPHAVAVCSAAASCQRFRALAKQVERLVIDVNHVSAVQIPSMDFGIALMLAQRSRGSLKVLQLVARDGFTFQETSVLRWIAATNAGLRELTILDGADMAEMGPRFKAASHCPHLLNLKLTGEKIHLIREIHLTGCRGGFKELKSLYLEGVTLNSNLLPELVSLCPKLQTLVLDGLKGVPNVELESKTLEDVTLRVHSDWSFVTDEGFANVALAMPALNTLCVGDVRGSLVVKDAPLKKVTLESFSNDLMVDFGRKAAVSFLALNLDAWPVAAGERKSLTVAAFTGILKQTTPQVLRYLSMPSFNPEESIGPSDITSCFQHMVELETLGLHAAVLVACGFGSNSCESTWNQFERSLQSMEFQNLQTLVVYVDHDSPFIFNAIEIIAKKSRKLRSLTIQGDSGLGGLQWSGMMLSQILKFQKANPRLEVNMVLPNKLEAVD